MTPVLVSIFFTFLIGHPIARWIDPRADAMTLAGVSYLYGSGAIFLLVLLLSVLGIRWSPVSVGVACAALFAISLRGAWRTSSRDARAAIPRLHGIDAATGAMIVGYALYATLSAPWEIDFWAIWGLKARVFLEGGALDWRFLESPWNLFQHPDYPLLVPLDFDFATIVGGSWDDRWLGLLYVAWGASLVTLVRSLAARETTPLFASLIAFGLAAPCLSRYIGLAEGALVAFGGAAVLFLREALRTGEQAAWRHGALLLGFAANCKNEGVALLGAVTIALVVVGPRAGIVDRVKKLWPAYALAAPWMVIRAIHSLPTDLAGGDVMSRLADRLTSTYSILALLAARLNQRWAWMALLVALLAVPVAAIVRERFVFYVTAIQLVFLVGAYFVTPLSVEWHVFASWQRITPQLAVPISFVVAMMLVEAVSAPRETPQPAPMA
jgi:hypothetical protein